MLTVTERGPNTKNGHPRWRYVCDCGKYGLTSGGNLRGGRSASCGCETARKVRERLTVHGHSKRGRVSVTYSTWSNMLQRVSNEKRHNYHRYGGRGIRVCDRWYEFAHFLADMGECPQGMELDRRDNELGYTACNCRWVTRRVNQRNRGSNHLVEWNGVRITVAEASELSGVRYRTILGRLARGWVGDSIFRKARKIKPRKKINQCI